MVLVTFPAAATTILSDDDVRIYMSDTRNVIFWGDSLLVPGDLDFLGTGSAEVSKKEFDYQRYLVFQKEGYQIEVRRVKRGSRPHKIHHDSFTELKKRKEDGRYVSIESFELIFEDEEDDVVQMDEYSYWHPSNWEVEVESEDSYSVFELMDDLNYRVKEGDKRSFSNYIGIRIKVDRQTYDHSFYSFANIEVVHLIFEYVDVYGDVVGEDHWFNDGNGTRTQDEADDLDYDDVLENIDESEGFVPFLNARLLGVVSDLQDKESIRKYFSDEEKRTRLWDPIEFDEVKDKVEANRPEMGVVVVETTTGHGSGAVIGQGYILTNHHVVTGADSLTVTFEDGSKFDVEMIRSNPFVDLALLKIDPISDGYETYRDSLIGFHIENSNLVNIGQDVRVVGAPLDTRFHGSVSYGMVTSMFELNGEQLIQTNANVNPGNSGGAIVSDDGHLMGVVSSKLMGIGVNHVGFAIPSILIQEALNIQIQTP